MFQVSIKKQNIITNQAIFATQELADAWLAKEVANKSYGMPERTIVTPAVLDEQGNEISPESSEVIPSEYEVIIEDVTVQVQAEAAKQARIQAGIKAREACQLVLDYIAGCNLDKELSMEQITQMQQTLAMPEAALRAARPSLAKAAITAITPDGILITEEEKQQALILLADY